MSTPGSGRRGDGGGHQGNGSGGGDEGGHMCVGGGVESPARMSGFGTWNIVRRSALRVTPAGNGHGLAGNGHLLEPLARSASASQSKEHPFRSLTRSASVSHPGLVALGVQCAFSKVRLLRIVTI
jgi:hypothetical protein